MNCKIGDYLRIPTTIGNGNDGHYFAKVVGVRENDIFITIYGKSTLTFSECVYHINSEFIKFEILDIDDVQFVMMAS